jgi:hypothetical protein
LPVGPIGIEGSPRIPRSGTIGHDVAVPTVFESFFVASAGSSAALIGLLFVAISVRPEHVFGGYKTSAGHFSIATGAFAAFLNVFFVSLGALVPSVNPGVFVLVMGAFALLNTLGLARGAWRGWRGGRSATRQAGLVVISLVIYGLELRYGWALLFGAPAEGAARVSAEVSGLSIMLLAAYGVGLGRAWELLRARRWGCWRGSFPRRTRKRLRLILPERRGSPAIAP